MPEANKTFRQAAMITQAKHGNMEHSGEMAAKLRYRASDVMSRHAESWVIHSILILAPARAHVLS